MTFARSEKVPPLNVNYKGLLAHSFLERVFIANENMSNDQLMLRHWFTENIISACSVYEEIRLLILKNEQQSQLKQSYLTLFILDIPRNLESLISILKRVCDAICVISKKNKNFKLLYTKYSDVFTKIATIRNNFEHFNRQLNNEKLVSSSVNIVFTNEGEIIEFRGKSIFTCELLNLIEETFREVCTLYPNFSESKPIQNHSRNLNLSVSVEIKQDTT